MRIPDETVRRRLELPMGDWRTQPGLRDSAVLAPIVERDGADHMVFTRRRDDLKHHAGEVSFPGGTREGDENAADCALREACEELGLRAEDLTILGRLPERISIAGFKVIPYAARLDPQKKMTPEEREVAEIFEIPCRAFLGGASWGHRPTTHPMARFRRVPYFDFGERRVWGLTGIILRDFVTQVMGFAPPV